MPEEATVPPDWSAHGACFGRDGLLYLPDWRRGFTVHELRALFFNCQQVRSLESELRLPKHQGYLLLPDGLPVARIGLTADHIAWRGAATQPPES